MANPFLGREGYLARLADEVAAELAQAGDPLPLPPDPDDPELDARFWELFVNRLTPDERRWLRTSG
jgi:hypothetical protein